MQAWKREVVEKLRGGIAMTEKRLGVEVLSAEARLLGPGRVEARDASGAATLHDARAVIIATGSAPAMPPIPGSRDNARVVDSTGLLDLKEVPKRLCVIGGGVIGVEFAGLFAALGSRVEVVEMMDEIVPFMDREQAPVLRRAMKGVAFRLGCKVESIEGATVHYKGKDGADAAAEADVVLMAVGRRPVLEGWGAKEAGLDLSAQGTGRRRAHAHEPARRLGRGRRDRQEPPRPLGLPDGRRRGRRHPRRRRRLAGRERHALRRDPLGRLRHHPEAAGVGMTEQEARRRA